MARAADDPAFFARVFVDGSPTTPDGRYLHWDELWYREPPPGLDRTEWWASMQLARSSRAVRLDALADAYASTGEAHALPFAYTDLPAIQERLHTFDRTNVVELVRSVLGEEDALTETRVRQLIEEAISSSEIEGAKPATRDVARQLVREGRTPSSRDERMILNNWRAMERILVLHRAKRLLSIDDVLEIHRILGDDALDVEGAEGRFRTERDAIDVADVEGTVWYVPPPAEGIEQRVQALLDFANGTHGGPFVHPVLRAIVSHFWMAYEHPFRDGNGRMARALFYWCMLRHGYEMAEFLSISGPIDRHAKAYSLSFVFSETESGDLTYFVLNQLEAITAALAEFGAHLRERAARARDLQQLVADVDTLNHRQRALLQHAIRHPAARYSIEGHASSHEVHYLTARRDLSDLAKRGYLVAHQDGQRKRFEPSKSLARRTR